MTPAAAGSRGLVVRDEGWGETGSGFSRAVAWRRSGGDASSGSNPKHSFGRSPADIGVTPGLAWIAEEVLGGQSVGDLG